LTRRGWGGKEEFMKVLAAKGLKCPKEGKPREYITDSEPVDVPDDSTYYRRLIADGSLLISEDKSYTSDKTYEAKNIKKEGGKK